MENGKWKVDERQRAKDLQTLWVVTELYYPEMTSTGYYLTAIAEGLTDDFDVKALCGQPNYSARGVRASSREVYNNVEIFRCVGTTLDKNIIPFRLLNMLTLSLSIFVKALFNFKKGDKVLVVTTPPSLPFITALASLIKGANYTLLIHDNYPEILIAVDKTSENSLLAKSVNYANRWLYKFAQKIIVCGRDMKTLVEKKTAGLDIPISFIPNWAELEQVEPRPRSENKLLIELNLQDKFVFLYAGNMGYPNDLESLTACAEKLKNDEIFHFIFLGSGVKRKYLEREVARKGLTNITILEPRPRTEQTEFLNACDVALVSLVKKMLGVSMPSRTYNILAVGKPILALTEEDSEVAKVINEDQVGWFVPPNNPDKLLKKIKQIYAERNCLEEMSKRAREAALKKYSLETAVSAYRRELTK